MEAAQVAPRHLYNPFQCVSSLALKLYRVVSQVACGGVSHRWVVEAIKAQDWFQEHASDVGGAFISFTAPC